MIQQFNFNKEIDRFKRDLREKKKVFYNRKAKIIGTSKNDWQKSYLIPGSGKEFSGKDYWDRFFKIRGTQAFEWYGEYENLFECIHKYIKPEDNVLVIGCGNSKLSENMYDVCFKHITNIDLSDIVIKQMSAKNKNRKDMKYLKMDMLNVRARDWLGEIFFKWI